MSARLSIAVRKSNAVVQMLLCVLSLACFVRASNGQEPSVSVKLVTAKNGSDEVVGRILAKTDNGSLLLEDRAGRLHPLEPKHFSDVTEQPGVFSYLSEDEMGAALLKLTGAGFAVHTTEHFVICSDASELYTTYCGRLLEKVHTEFYALFDGSPVKLRPLATKLPVLVFRESAVFQEFAKRQHPDTDFSDVPGYYSIRDNQMLITAISGDRSFRTNSDVIRELKKRPRQVETIVHEAVHQLSYNAGLQIRYAANPTWLSEGLAVYFETASGRGSLIWSRPGEPNRTHLPGFKNAMTDQNLRLPLTELLSSDTAFSSSERAADAYAEGWALTMFLIRSERDAFDQLMLRQQQRVPLKTVTGDERLAEITEVTSKTPEQLEAAVIRFMSRIHPK